MEMADCENKQNGLLNTLSTSRPTQGERNHSTPVDWFGFGIDFDFIRDMSTWINLNTELHGYIREAHYINKHAFQVAVEDGKGSGTWISWNSNMQSDMKFRHPEYFLSEIIAELIKMNQAISKKSVLNRSVKSLHFSWNRQRPTSRNELKFPWW